MKKILGSLLFLGLSLYARSTYEWTVQVDDKQMYLHQATILSMQCRFDKSGKNDDVEFIAPKDTGFEFKLFNENRHFDGNIQTISYKYLIFAKKAGKISLDLKPKMLFTSQSAIDNVIIGRDNVNDLETEKEFAKLSPITIEVLETTSNLTGTLELSSLNDTQEASAYEPVHLEVSIKGEGNLQEIQEINFEIDGVEVFSDDAQKEFSLSSKGYKGVWTQRFAFVGDKDFVIPSVKVHYFDLSSQKEKVLKSEPIFVKIKSDGIKRENLIDEVNLPSTQIKWSEYTSYMYYALTFLAGFIVAKLVRLPTRTKKNEKGMKIKEAKTAKELLEVLIVCDKDLFAQEIQTLEACVYKGDKITLSTIKKSALSRL